MLPFYRPTYTVHEKISFAACAQIHAVGCVAFDFY